MEEFWLVTVYFMAAVSNVCEKSKSLFINYPLRLYCMMNVCCFTTEGHIHKVFTPFSLQ